MFRAVSRIVWEGIADWGSVGVAAQDASESAEDRPLAHVGADVAVNYRSREQQAMETCAEIENLGRRAVAAATDVSVAADVTRLVETVEAELGPVCIMVDAPNGQVIPGGRGFSRVGPKPGQLMYHPPLTFTVCPVM